MTYNADRLPVAPLRVSHGSFAVGRKKSWIPRSLSMLLVVIGLYILYPVGDIPLLGISFSAVLYALLFLEMGRYGIPWRLEEHSGLVGRAGFFLVMVMLSYIVNVLVSGHAVRGYEFALGLRLPYWILCMILTSVVVSRTKDPGMYVRALAYGVMVLGGLRLGFAVFGGLWKVGRVFALTQNTYGFIFSTFWPFALMALLERRGRKFYIWGGTGVLFLAIVLNGSRGSWIAVITTTALMYGFMFMSRKGPAKALRTVFVVGSLGGLVVVMGLVLIPSAAKGLLVQRVETFQNLEEDNSYQTRVAMRNKAVVLYKKHPILGVGPTRFSKVHTQFDLPWRLRGKSLEKLNTKSAHSAYFQLLAETGLCGVITFAMLFVWLLYRGGRAAFFALNRGYFWPLAMWAGFIGMSIHLFVISALMGTQPWLIYGMLSGAIAWCGRGGQGRM